MVVQHSMSIHAAPRRNTPQPHRMMLAKMRNGRAHAVQTPLESRTCRSQRSRSSLHPALWVSGSPRPPASGTSALQWTPARRGSRRCPPLAAARAGRARGREGAAGRGGGKGWREGRREKGGEGEKGGERGREGGSEGGKEGRREGGRKGGRGEGGRGAGGGVHETKVYCGA